MGSRRAVAGATLFALTGVVMLLLAGTVSAVPVQSWAAAASGSAFAGTLNGNTISIGQTNVTATVGPSISAVGQGIFLPGNVGGATRSSSTYPGDEGPEDASASNALPAPFNAVDVAAEGHSSASVVNGEVRGFASAEASSFALGLQGGLLSDLINGVVGALPPQLDPITDQLIAVLNQALNTITNLLGIRDVLTATLGGTTSTVTTQGSRAVADCVSSGGSIDLLPGVGGPLTSVLGGALARITVQGSAAHAESDGTAGGAVGSFTPALVNISIPSINQNVTVGGQPGETVDSATLPGGQQLAPVLRLIVSAADGTAGPNPANPLQFDSQANAVRIQAIVGGGAVSLDVSLARCTAQAAVSAQQITPGTTTTTTTTTTTLPGTLPVTGGGIPPIFFVAGIVSLVGAGALLYFGLRRRSSSA